MSIKAITESLLGRVLTEKDGLSIDTIKNAEQTLNSSIPSALKELYLTVGLIPQFMQAFQQFCLPEQLYKEADLLIFLEENQGVCYWGVDEQGNVFQCHEDQTRYDLQLNLAEFIEIVLYYQVAQGAEFNYYTTLLDEELAPLLTADSWSLVVDNNGLAIYQLNNYLLWYFQDEQDNILEDTIYFVSLLEPPQDIISRYGLENL